MTDVEDVLRRELRAVDDALTPPGPRVAAALARGRVLRRRRRRVRAAAAAAALVALAAVVPWPGRGGPGPAPAAGLRQVQRVDPAVARHELATRGQLVYGEPVEAWQWTDARGRGLLLTTLASSVPDAPGVASNGTLRAYLGTGLDTAAGTLTVPVTATNDVGGAPCDVVGGLSWTSGATRVSDTDGDDTADVTVGWWRFCRGDPGPAECSLAVVTADRTYTLSAEAAPARPGDTIADLEPGGAAARRPRPVPVAAAWPPGTLAAATADFTRLYR